MIAGRSGTISSSCAFVGDPPGNGEYSQPRPLSQPSPGCAVANAAIAAWTCRSVVSPARSTSPSASPPETKCTWASLKPGTTEPPRASTTRVSGPRSAEISAVVPRRRMVFPRTATASAVVPASSEAKTRPLTITRSAVSVVVGGAAGWQAVRVRAIESSAPIAATRRTPVFLIVVAPSIVSFVPPSCPSCLTSCPSCLTSCPFPASCSCPLEAAPAAIDGRRRGGCGWSPSAGGPTRSPSLPCAGCARSSERGW